MTHMSLYILVHYFELCSFENLFINGLEYVAMLLLCTALREVNV